MQKTRIAAIKIAMTRTALTKRKTAIAINMAATTTKRQSRTPTPTKRALDVFIAPSNTDVNGSYTGRPKNLREKPVHDADDL